MHEGNNMDIMTTLKKPTLESWGFPPGGGKPLPSEPTVVHRPIDSTVLPQVPSTHPRSLSTGTLVKHCQRSHWKSAARYATMAV